MSKVENERTIPSLPVLLQIINSLEKDLTVFVEGVSEDNSYAYLHEKSDDYIFEEREESEGFSFFSIMIETIKNVTFHPYILKLEPGAQQEKLMTDGFTFLYLIDGQFDYVLDKEFISFNIGDSLFFDGRIPHVPQNNSEKTATVLVIYLLTTSI